MGHNEPVQRTAHAIFQAQVEKDCLRCKRVFTMPDGSINKINLPVPDRLDRSLCYAKIRPGLPSSESGDGGTVGRASSRYLA